MATGWERRWTLVTHGGHGVAAVDGPSAPATANRRLHHQLLSASPATVSIHPPRRLVLRFSWNKSQLEKARNEGGTQTNPLATAVRGVLTGVPTAVLVVASITRLSDTSYNK